MASNILRGTVPVSKKLILGMSKCAQYDITNVNYFVNEIR